MQTQRRASVNSVSLNNPAGLPRTVGELRAAGPSYRTVKEELRENLRARMRSGDCIAVPPKPVSRGKCCPIGEFFHAALQ